MINRNATVGDPKVFQSQYDAFARRFVSSIPVLKEGRHCHKMQVVCNDVLRGISYSLILERDAAEITRLVSYAEQLGVNSFKMALNPDRAIILNVGDVNVEVKVENVSEIHLNSGFWQTIFCLSIVLRDEAAIIYLKDIPNEVINPRLTVYDPLDFAVVDVLKSLFDFVSLKGVLTNYWLIREKASYSTSTRRNFNEYLVVPMIRVVEALLLKDQQEFDKALAAALTQHAAFYKEEKDGFGDSNDLYGWLSFSLLAVCVRALDSGLIVNTVSDYIPMSIMTHKFSARDFDL